MPGRGELVPQNGHATAIAAVPCGQVDLRRRPSPFISRQINKFGHLATQDSLAVGLQYSMCGEPPAA